MRLQITTDKSSPLKHVGVFTVTVKLVKMQKDLSIASVWFDHSRLLEKHGSAMVGSALNVDIKGLILR